MAEVDQTPNLLDVPWLGEEHTPPRSVPYRGAILAWGPFVVETSDSPDLFFGCDLALWNDALVFYEAERQGVREWALVARRNPPKLAVTNGVLRVESVDHGKVAVRGLKPHDGMSLAGKSPMALSALTDAVRELLGLD